MAYVTWKERKDQGIIDIVNLVAGAFLFLAPWLFGFSTETVTAWNAWLVGAVIVALAAAALYAFAVWESWANLVLGLWLVVSPWALGFAGGHAAWSHLVPGLVVAGLSAAELWLARQDQPRVQA